MLRPSSARIVERGQRSELRDNAERRARTSAAATTRNASFPRLSELQWWRFMYRTQRVRKTQRQSHGEAALPGQPSARAGSRVRAAARLCVMAYPPHPAIWQVQ